MNSSALKEMYPASRSKSTDKKARKETSKASLKSSGSATASSSIPASAYNPISGTFHIFDLVPSSSGSPLHSNGRFRNIDDADEHLGSSFGSGIDYDSISNNGSWSGESEDHKEKGPNPPVRQEAIPGTDNDKREKIRQKNEKKHQRQKERRAQELHERCSGYLMSRKLEALAQQLVAMGFFHEQATMALILNEGKVEESVTWLLEGTEEADKKNPNLGGGNLKIDISEELAHIEDMEMRYKCTKQEVQRAVVAAEGNLDKAAEALRVMKEEPPSPPSKPEETSDPPTSGIAVPSITATCNSEVRSQLKSNPPSAIQQRREEKDFNYTKAAVMVGGSSQPGSQSVQPQKTVEPKLDWAKPLKTVMPAEKRWPSAGPNSSISYSLASPMQASPPPAKAESYVAVGSEAKNLPYTVREPVIMMQRPQSLSTKQIPTSVSSSPLGATASWYPANSVEIMKSNGFMTNIPSTVLSMDNINSNQLYHQFHHHQQPYFISSSSPDESPGSIYGNTSCSRASAAPTIAAASSLGLFPRLGSTGTSGVSSPVDWSTAGSLAQFDYTNIDWSLDRGLSSPKPIGLWKGAEPTWSMKNSQMYDSNTNAVNAKASLRLGSANGNSVPIPGLKDGVVTNGDSSAGGSPEWTSPFEGNDLFSLPRRFVSSPSL